MLNKFFCFKIQAKKIPSITKKYTLGFITQYRALQYFNELNFSIWHIIVKLYVKILQSSY